jgi:hypothetical protein
MSEKSSWRVGSGVIGFHFRVSSSVAMQRVPVKLKSHGLLERDGCRYAYRLTAKGVDVALLFVFFHKRLCGPLANSRFHHKPNPESKPNSKLETAYHKADKAIQNIVNLLKAA